MLSLGDIQISYSKVSGSTCLCLSVHTQVISGGLLFSPAVLGKWLYCYFIHDVIRMLKT